MNAFLLAWRTLKHQWLRTLISLLGVGFAVVLVFMQLGFLGGIERSATQLYDRLNFDLMLTSSEYLEMNRASDFTRDRLAQAEAVEGVASALPLTLATGLWRDPRSLPVRPHWTITMLGVDPATAHRVLRAEVGPIFDSPAEMQRGLSALAQSNTLLLDRKSWPEYGEDHHRRLGARVELNDLEMQIVGEVTIGTGFGPNGLVVTSEDTLYSSTGLPPDRISFGLIRLAPDANQQQVIERLRAALPKDVCVHVRANLRDRERDFWVNQTAAGQFFWMGVGVALLVGGVFVTQIMAGDIQSHLPEYATVKALGYPNSFLARVVLWESVLLALSGYVPGLVVALALCDLTERLARVPVSLTPERVVIILVLTVGMCLVSGLVAMRQVRKADPADLF